MKNRLLIYEVYKGNSFANFKLNESQEGVPPGMMRVTGIAAVLGVKNRNNRVYNEENYLYHIKLLQDDIKYGLYGELEHPEGFTINLNNVSHKIEAVWYEPATKRVMITILLLDTPKGKIAQEIIRSGGSIRVSSRAMGSVDKNHQAIISKLVTYDIVGTPGFRETDLRLSESIENATLIHESSLCESFYIEANENDLNECMKVSYDGDIKTIINKHLINENMKRNSNLALLESYIQKPQPSAGTQLNTEALGGAIEKWFTQSVAPIIESWVIDNVFPLYESYCSRKKINESLGKDSCSFSAFYSMNIAESARSLFESTQPLNGTIVLSEEEQEVLQKCQQGQQLSEEEQQIAKQAQQKLQQQQQQIEEALTQPLNGTIVLSEEEQDCLNKLQQGEQMSQEELQIAQQAMVKQQQGGQQQVSEGQQLLTQQEQQVIQKCMQGQQLTARQQQIYQQAQQKLQQQQERLQQQQQGGQQRQQQQQKKQQLQESYNDLNDRLTQSYRRLIESEDPAEQEQINQEIDDIKQQCDDIKQQMQDIDEGQQSSQQFKQAQQKIQNGEELTEDDLDGLSQDEIQDLIQQQKQCSEAASDYDDPNDAKVFEQAQLTQQEQEVVKKQQQGQQLTQEEQQIFQQAQQKIQQQQLPENDKQVNESIFGKRASEYIDKSGSLLEALQKRMGMALEKN